MPRSPAGPASSPVRVLLPGEYPPEITQRDGAYTPDVRFVAIHPLGTYYVDHMGAGHMAAYFLPKRKGSRAKNIGGASSLRGALARIQSHEDRMISPDAPREEGRTGPVNIFNLGKRVGGGAKTRTQLDLEIEEILRRTNE